MAQISQQDPNPTGGSACFVCGPANPAGLQVAFRLEGDVCRAEFTPGPEHMGYDNVTHGGILFALLDDVMANCLWLQGTACFTGRAEVRYRHQLPVGVPIRLEGRCLQRKRRLAKMQGRLLRQDNDQLVVEASANFMLPEES